MAVAVVGVRGGENDELAVPSSLQTLPVHEP